MLCHHCFERCFGICLYECSSKPERFGNDTLDLIIPDDINLLRKNIDKTYYKENTEDISIAIKDFGLEANA